MKKTLMAVFAGCCIFGMSCQKSLSVVNSDNDGDTTLGDGNLLVRTVSVAGDGSDSSITEYTYNTAGQLMQQHTTGLEPVVYSRDLAGRLTGARAKTNTADSTYTNVYYTASTGTQVAYILYGITNAGKAPDSMAFTYAGGHVATTSYYTISGGSATLSYYQNWAFDGSGNVTQLNVYLGDSTFNIGYEFEYDNKTNPKYAADDARLPVEWGYTLSPNNVIKQINHYSGAAPMPDDYVTYTYDYNTASRPVTGVHAGTALGPQTEQVRFYYH